MDLRDLTLGELCEIDERVEEGTASTAERELHASAKAAIRPFAKKLEHAARSVWMPALAARRRMPARTRRRGRSRHATLSRERRATRRAQARSPGGDDPSEPPLAEIPLPAFRRELRRALGGRARVSEPLRKLWDARERRRRVLARLRKGGQR
jgi:hypothetical protein